jgi:hypothetical protein
MRGVSLLVVLGLMLVLVGCGGGEPATAASLPSFPGASTLEPGSNPMVDTMVDTMTTSVGDQASVETTAYTLPADAEWEAIKQFYTDELADTDWTSSPEMETENEVISVIGWQRGGMASEQVLMVGYMPPLLGSEPVLIVSLFSE